MSAINARCGVSQQTIADGDMCRVVLVTQSSSYEEIEVESHAETHRLRGIANTSAYLNCLWRPKTHFVRAIYDDYGISKLVLESNIERSEVATMFDELARSCAVTKAGKNPYHDLAFDFSAFIAEHAPKLHQLREPLKWHSPPIMLSDSSLDEELQKCWVHLHDNVRRHRVFAHGYCNAIRPLAAFFVHERAYQALVEVIAQYKNWEGTSYEMEAYIRQAIKKARGEEQAAYADADAETDPIEKTEEARKRRYSQYFTESLRSTMNAFDVESCFFGRVARNGFQYLVGKLFDEALTEDEFIVKTVPLMLDRAAICAMEYLSIYFAPVCYVGADVRNKSGSAYSAFIGKVADQVSQEREKLF